MFYTPPWHLTNGLLMTLYTALRVSKKWEDFTVEPEPITKSIFLQAQMAFRSLANMQFLKTLKAQ
jgi:predicted alpha/beta-fold hydrolase